MAIIGMPDTERRELMDPIYVPRALSYLAYGDFRAKVVGLNDYPPDQQPPIELVYYAYHIMVGLGTIFIAVMAPAALLLWRGTLFGRAGPVDPDARHAVPLHREPGGVDGRRRSGVSRGSSTVCSERRRPRPPT